MLTCTSLMFNKPKKKAIKNKAKRKTQKGHVSTFRSTENSNKKKLIVTLK